MDPFFFEPSTLNIHTKYDITVEPRQLAFNYGMCNPESGDDGKEENDGMLVLRIVTVKYQVHGNNRRKYTERKLFYLSYNYDTGLLCLVSRKYLTGRPM